VHLVYEGFQADALRGTFATSVNEREVGAPRKSARMAGTTEAAAVPTTQVMPAALMTPEAPRLRKSAILAAVSRIK